MKVLNLGSLNYDHTYSLDHIVNPGETISSSNMTTSCGGKGLNQSIALSKAGVKVSHAGVIGTDGKDLLYMLEQNGVDCKNIIQCEDKNGHAIIQIDKSGQNCIVLYPGSNRRLTKEHIDSTLANYSEGDMLVLQNEVNLLDYIIDKAYEKKLFIVLNPSPFDENIAKCDLNKVSMFLINEIEGEQISAFSDPQKTLDYMMTHFPEAKVVLTLGKNGVMYKDKDIQSEHGIFNVKTVDTTGAGDTFTGYFLAEFLKNTPIPLALKTASAASALAVTKKGAAAAIPTYDEVMKFLKDNDTL